MTSPIRTDYHVAVEFPKEPKTMTLREAVEWYKQVFHSLHPLGAPNALEMKLVNERWVELVKGVAEREGVPLGMLSYFLGELGNTEIQLAETVAEESAVAMSYSVPDVQE